MTTNFESATSSDFNSGSSRQSGWLRIGLIAITSAVLGGMGAAWWYRKTLIRMRQAESLSQNPQFGISDNDSADEI
jgi:hypothetical protein